MTDIDSVDDHIGILRKSLNDFQLSMIQNIDSVAHCLRLVKFSMDIDRVKKKTFFPLRSDRMS